MYLKFQLNPLNGSGVVAIINFEFNQLSFSASVLQKLNNILIIQRYILWKFKCNPFNSWEVVDIMNLNSNNGAV